MVLSPALPSELLSFIVTRCAHPTTLIVCSSHADFLSGLVSDVRGTDHGSLFEDVQPEEWNGRPERPSTPTPAARRLLQAPLYQVATARHIRMVFVPTVSHLRAFLAVFSPEDSKIPEPPPSTRPGLPGPGSGKRPPLLVIYGFVELHRHTSEWSAQGMSSTAATLVEAARRESFRAVIVDGKGVGHGGEQAREAMPVLSGTARRRGPDAEEGGWTGRTVEVRRILGRWFRFQHVAWETDDVYLQ